MPSIDQRRIEKADDFLRRAKIRKLEAERDMITAKIKRLEAEAPTYTADEIMGR